MVNLVDIAIVDLLEDDRQGLIIAVYRQTLDVTGGQLEEVVGLSQLIVDERVAKRREVADHQDVLVLEVEETSLNRLIRFRWWIL